LSGDPFIPAALDDAGLTPAQFRVFCRIARRGHCSESIANMAKGCRLADNTVWPAIRSLVALGMVARVARPGRSTILTVRPPSQWSQPTPKDHPPQDKGRVVKQGDTHPKQDGDHPPQKRRHKGSPVEGNPFQGSLLSMPIELPAPLRTERMREKWERWMTYRKALKRCKDFEAMFREQADWLGKFDEATAFEILSQSIRQGWQGLFEPKTTQRKPQPNRPAPDAQF